MTQRSFFSFDGTHWPSYYVYQPICLFLEPFVVQQGLSPNSITGTRALAGAAAAAAIVASGVDSESSRRWLWLFCLWVCILYINVSDNLDGYIARKYALTSKEGASADGQADFWCWIITWLAALYAFGWKRVWIPAVIWSGIVLSLMMASWLHPKYRRESGYYGFECHPILPLLITTFYACYPVR